MKKTIRVIALTLILTILSGLLPLSMFPSFPGNIANAANTTISRVEWVRELVNLFDMTVEDNNVPDDYFYDIEPGSEFYRDVMVATEFGIVDIQAGGSFRPNDPVTREFAAQTMNFCLGFEVPENVIIDFGDLADILNPADAWIAIEREWFELDAGNFMPNENITQAEKDTIFADAAMVWTATEVDPFHSNTFEFESGVIEVPLHVEVSIDENDVVTIIDNPVPISEGQTFIIYLNELPLAFIAQSVIVDGSVTTITTGEKEIEDILIDSDAQGIIEVDLSSAEAIGDIEIIIEEVEEYGIQAFSSSRVGTIRIPAQNIPLGSGRSLRLEGSLSNVILEYKNHGTSYAYIGVSGNYNITTTASFDFTDDGNPRTRDIIRIPVAGVGYITVALEYSLSGTVALTFGGSFLSGLEYSSGGGFRMHRSFNRSSFTITSEVNLSVGLRVTAGVNLFFAKGSVWVSVGATVRVNTRTNIGTPRTCVHIDGHMYANVGASASILWKSFNRTFPIWTAHNSPVRIVHHIEDGRLVARCAHGGTNFFSSVNSRFGSTINGGGLSGDWRQGTPTVVSSVFTFTVLNNQVTITGYTGSASTLVIPSTVMDWGVIRPVVIIGSRAFQNRNDLTAVVIPDSVTTIRTEAFQNCTNLRNVTLSRNLFEINNGAFNDCTSLRSIEIPRTLGSVWGPVFGNSGLQSAIIQSGATSIPTRLFENARRLDTIIIPETVTSIGWRAFANCVNLKSIALPRNLNEIGEQAFTDCILLEEISIPDTVTNIGSGAFMGCTGLKNVKLSGNLERLGWGAFRDCISLKSIKIPASLAEEFSSPRDAFADSGLNTVTFEQGITRIVSGLFSNAKKLEVITIPDTVTSIGSSAFMGCTGLIDITLPQNLAVIESNAFADCVSLETLNFPDGLLTIREGAFSGASSLREITLPDSVTSIGFGAFQDCSSLEKVVLPNELPRIEGGTFRNASSLQEITIPDSVTSIGFGAFQDCSSIEELIIPDSVTSIGGSAFEGCTSLSNVTLSGNLETLGEQAFRNTSLTSIEIPRSLTNVPPFYGSKGPFSDTGIKDISFEHGTTIVAPRLFSDLESLEAIVIPDTVTAIKDQAFGNCKNLKNVSLPNILTEIGNDAFIACTSLEEIILPDGLLRIGENAFRESGLKEIVIPSSVTWVGPSAFRDCNSLLAATVNASGSLGFNVFSGNKAMHTLYYANTVNSIIPVIVGLGIGQGNDNLANIKLGHNIQSIPESAFRALPALVDIDIPRFVASIPNNAFADNPGLKNVFIPPSVTSIHANAFLNSTQAVIHGLPGSTAQTYANSRGMTFVPINAPITSLSFQHSVHTQRRNSSFRIPLVISPAFDTDTLTFSSSNNAIAFVNNTGLVQVYNRPGTVEITVTNGTLSATTILHVVEPNIAPTITTSTLPNGTINVAYNQTLAATGTVPIVWSVSTGFLPTGLSLSSEGVISGTPTELGTFTFTVSANNGVSPNDSKEISIEIIKNIQNAPSAPTLSSNDAVSVTLNQIIGAEYGFNTTNTAPPSWQSEVLFDGLDPNTTYYFFVRMAETLTHEASPPSNSLSVTTDKVPLGGAVITLASSTLMYTGSAITPSITSVTVGNFNPVSTDYTVSYSNNTNVGTATVAITATNSGDFLGSASTTFTITQATVLDILTTTNDVSISAYQARSASTAQAVIDLAGLPSTVEVSLDSGVSTSLGITWVGIGTHNIQGASYTATGTLTDNSNVIIDTAPKVVNVNVTAVNAINPTFSDTNILVDAEGGVKNATALGTTVLPTSGSITAGGATVSYTIDWGSQTLDVTAVGNTTLFNGTITYDTTATWLTIPSDTVSRRVTVRDRTVVTITATASNTTYTGLPYAGLSNVSRGEYTGVLIYSYVGTGDTAYGPLPTAPTNVGTYAVTISIPDGNTEFVGRNSFTFTINRRVITITADNKSITAGEAEPAYTFTVTGLVIGESLITNPTVSSPASNVNVPGSYAIIASGASATLNYTITYVNGVLTVLPPIEPPPPTDQPWQPPESTNRFRDVPNDNWQNAAVSWADRNNITTGSPAGSSTFRPNGDVTRAEFVTFFHRIYGSPSVPRATFRDMPGNEAFQNAISWAFAEGITTGSPAGSNTFMPNANITREQIAAMLYRYVGGGIPAPEDRLGGYTDENRISTWAGAREAVNWAAYHGIMGQNVTTLNPRGNATRAEAVTMLYRVVEIFNLSAP